MQSLARRKIDPTEGRRSRRRRELHESILATASELFAREGFEATTVDRIAQAADIAPATFFNHFRSKEHVLREVGQDVFTRFRRLVEEQLAREVGTIERLHGFADRSTALVRRAPEMTRRVLIAVLRSSRPGESGAELASMQSDFAELLRDGRDRLGDVPASLDTGLVAEIFVSVVIGAMTHWINDPRYPLETRLRAALSLVADRLLAMEPGTVARAAVAKSQAPAAKRPKLPSTIEPPAATSAGKPRRDDTASGRPRRRTAR
jgi:AcrR family transcriptional regulator